MEMKISLLDKISLDFIQQKNYDQEIEQCLSLYITSAIKLNVIFTTSKLFIFPIFAPCSAREGKSFEPTKNTKRIICCCFFSVLFLVFLQSINEDS